MRSVRLIATLGVVCTLLVDQSSAGFFGLNWPKRENKRDWEAELNYDLLNSELVQNVNEDGPLPNLLAALEWLKMVSGEMELDPQLNLPSREALIRFTALLKLMDPENPHCDMEAYSILKDNELASGVDISRPSNELGALRRVEDVVHQVAVDHASQCRYEYPAIFEKAKAAAPAKIIKDITKMLDAVIKTSKRLVFEAKNRYTDTRQTAAVKAQGVSMKGQDEATALLLYLRHASRMDRENRFLSVKPNPLKRGFYIVDEQKVVEMMGRYIYSRCEFMQSNYEYIMKPAMFDQEIFDRHNKYRAINDRTADFMIWVQYYHICRDIMHNKKVLEDNVIDAIWSELKPKETSKYPG